MFQNFNNAIRELCYIWKPDLRIHVLKVCTKKTNIPFYVLCTTLDSYECYEILYTYKNFIEVLE